MPAVHDDLTIFPIHVIKGHSQHLATAQTEPGRKQQDGVITLTRYGAAIATPEQSLDLLRWERIRYVRHSPVSHSADRGRQVCLDLSAQLKKLQEGTQRCHGQSGMTSSATLSVTKNEAMQVP